MPAVSPKQFGFMQAARAGKLKGMGGPSAAVAKDFVDKTSPNKRSSFAKALAKKRKSSGSDN